MGFHFFDSNNSTISCQANLTYSPQTSASHSETCDHWSGYPPQREAFSRSTGNERFLTLIPALNRPSVWDFTENNRYLRKSLIFERSTMQSRFAPTPIPDSLPAGPFACPNHADSLQNINNHLVPSQVQIRADFSCRRKIKRRILFQQRIDMD